MCVRVAADNTQTRISLMSMRCDVNAITKLGWGIGFSHWYALIACCHTVDQTADALGIHAGSYRFKLAIQAGTKHGIVIRTLPYVVCVPN